MATKHSYFCKIVAHFDQRSFLRNNILAQRSIHSVKKVKETAPIRQYQIPLSLLVMKCHNFAYLKKYYVMF